MLFNAPVYASYLSIMGEAHTRPEVSIWVYCLIPDHCHWIVVPEHPDSLRQLSADGHRGDWQAYLNVDDNPDDIQRQRAHSRTGRPLGTETFSDALAQATGRQLRKQLSGRKPK
jgi:hypothetical protein